MEIYDFSNRPRGYDIELSEQEGEIVTVTGEQIDEVIWETSQKQSELEPSTF